MKLLPAETATKMPSAFNWANSSSRVDQLGTVVAFHDVPSDRFTAVIGFANELRY